MFGERLKELRRRNDFSIDKLVEMYNKRFDGRMNKSTLSRYENGLQSPNYKTVCNLAELFEVSTDYLFGNDAARSSSTKGVQIPVLGYVKAGIPVEAVEEILDFEEIPVSMAAQGDYFALRVTGDSMAPRMTDGDVVIVRKQSDVDSGDIAIVLINGNDATIKKVQKFQGGINLIPFNPAYNVLSFTNKEIESLPVCIIGKVVELRAKFD